MPTPTWFSVQNIIGTAMTGILGVLWFDLRKMKDREDAHVQRLGGMLDGYMTLEKHDDVSGKEESDMKLYIAEKLKDHTKEIIAAIKHNGGSHG